jgi:diguanylate cyclase (GGDEF)-like protein
LLKRAAAAWRETIRDGTLLARFGGEEFALLIRGGDQFDAIAVAERLRVCTPAEVTCSAGLAWRGDGEHVTSLVHRADEALYAAKLNGRAQVAVAGPHGEPAVA